MSHFVLVKLEEAADFRTVRKALHALFEEGKLVGHIADLPFMEDVEPETRTKPKRTFDNTHAAVQALWSAAWPVKSLHR